MADEEHFTIASKDVSGIPQAPDVEFVRDGTMVVAAAGVYKALIDFESETEAAVHISEGAMLLHSGRHFAVPERSFRTSLVSSVCAMIWSYWRARELRRIAVSEGNTLQGTSL